MKSILCLSLMFVCCSMPLEAAEVVPDVHACGSLDGIEYPNKPKVRLSFTKSGDQTPTEHSVFFLDPVGGSYFRNFPPLDRQTLEKIWAKSKQRENTFCFWGQYAGERVENFRDKYYIDVKFKSNKVDSYRIRGPRVISSKWTKPDLATGGRSI